MDHDERDRRDQPEETDHPGSGQEPDAAPPAGEPTWTPSDDEPEAYASPADIESWPSQDASTPVEPSRSWPTEPPEAGSAAGWPTEPPERGDEPILEPRSEPTTETTTEPSAAEWDAAMATPPSDPAPDVDDASPPEPAFATDEAPPSEVEAYPAAAPVEDVPEPSGAPLPAHAVPADESVTGESTQCPRCGTENRPGLAFCRNCGQRLVAAGVSTTVERPGTPEGTQACPRCGTHNRAGVAFCQNCGANLRGTAPGYVPPAAPAAEVAAEPARRGGAVLGPVVLLIGLVGMVTGYLLPFAFGGDSLFDRAFGAGGYGIGFWNALSDAGGSVADQAYLGLAAAVPVLGLLLLVLAVAGMVRAAPGPLQVAGLVVALLWSVGLIVLFVAVEVGGAWGGDIVSLLRDLTPAGIIFFLASLIVVIGALTRFGRS